MPTSLSQQIETVQSETSDLVAENASSEAPAVNFDPFVPLFSGAVEKSAPDNLAEEVDNARYRSGAVIMIVDLDRQDEILYITNKFFLQSMSIQNKERVQLLETFDVPTISFFGSTVKVYQFSAVAVDHPSQDIPYKTMHQSSILHLYQNHLRGTKLAENNRIAIMQVNNHVMYGYPINLNTNYNATQDKLASFSLSFVVTRHELSLPGVVNEDQLERLYTNRKELENEYISNIDSVLTPINRLLIIEGDSIQNMKSSVVRINFQGIENAEGKPSRLKPLDVEQVSYNTLFANYPDAFEIIRQRSESLANILQDKVDSGLSEVSSKLIQWDENYINSFLSSASMIGQNWTSYVEYKTYLQKLNDLRRDLESFKTQLTTLSNRLDNL